MSKESAPVKDFGSFGPRVKIHCQKEQVCRQRKSQEVRSLQITKNLRVWDSFRGNFLATKTGKLSVCMELKIGAKNCFRQSLQQKMWFCEAFFCWSLVTTTGITRALVLAITLGFHVTRKRGSG